MEIGLFSVSPEKNLQKFECSRDFQCRVPFIPGTGIGEFTAPKKLRKITELILKLKKFHNHSFKIEQN